MKKQIPVELVYQLSALVIATILVHLVYMTVIRPNADAVLEQRAAQSAAGQTVDNQRSIYVVLEGYEQESCFILFFWAFAIMGYKTRSTLHERKLHQRSLVNVSAGVNILPEDVRSYTRPLQALSERDQNALLPRALTAALNRFASTENVQDVAEAVKTVCETEYERLETELSIIRYIAWAIPSIGFIGTVRGIGDALGQVYQAVEGDIAGVTASLGVAFNSTFIALLISILLMFLLHQLQLIQERLVLDTQHYCDHELLRNLRTRNSP